MVWTHRKKPTQPFLLFNVVLQIQNLLPVKIVLLQTCFVVPCTCFEIQHCIFYQFPLLFQFSGCCGFFFTIFLLFLFLLPPQAWSLPRWVWRFLCGRRVSPPLWTPETNWWTSSKINWRMTHRGETEPEETFFAFQSFYFCTDKNSRLPLLYASYASIMLLCTFQRDFWKICKIRYESTTAHAHKIVSPALSALSALCRCPTPTLPPSISCSSSRLWSPKLWRLFSPPSHWH